MPSSFRKNPSGKRSVNSLFVFVLYVALKKRISSKMCILSCFVWLKYVLFNILCVFGALDLHKKFTRRVDNVPTRHTTLFLLSFTNYSSGFFFNLWNVTLLVYAPGACLCVLWPRKCCNLSSCRKFISCNCVHCSKYAVVCFSCRSLLASWIS